MRANMQTMNRLATCCDNLGVICTLFAIYYSGLPALIALTVSVTARFQAAP